MDSTETPLDIAHADQSLERTHHAPAWTSATARPLSDIREITEPSLLGPLRGKHRRRDQHSSSSSRASVEGGRLDPNIFLQKTDSHLVPAGASSESGLRQAVNQDSEAESIPRFDGSAGMKDVLRTRRDYRPVNSPPGRSHSVHREPCAIARPSCETYRTIPNRRHSRSPVKAIVSRLDPACAERFRRMPSRTYVKQESPANHDILDHPNLQHHRISVDLQMSAPMFVGGSSVEGLACIIVDEAGRFRNRKSLVLERIVVDLLGVEEVSGPKRFVFLALANELIDLLHPPPVDMVKSQIPLSPAEQAWVLSPSVTCLPFLITIPLEVGPPPFVSKHARIRYVLAATLLIRDSGRHLSVRSTQETILLSVYDPEKALTSLPSPLTATDEYTLRRGHGGEVVTVTAGLHRQVWVSGTTLFVDIHVINHSRKQVRKIELQLERVILCYRHTAASTREMSAGQARLFDQLDRLVVCNTVVKPGHLGWTGIPPYSTALRTCNLDLPRGHATVKCNKFFEVRYYLNVSAFSSHTRLVAVQLPIILVHMNSLDVPTNSVAQVAAAIDEKRGHKHRADRHGVPASRCRPSRNLQGRAFAAPRSQSLERQQADQDDMRDLGRQLDLSPRKHKWNRMANGAVESSTVENFTFRTPPSNRLGRVFVEDDAERLRECLDHRRNGSTESAVVFANRQHVQEHTRPSTALRNYSLDIPRTQPGLWDAIETPKLRLQPQRSFQRVRPHIWESIRRVF